MTKKEKIHYLLFVEGDPRYLCNQACGITKGKVTKNWKHITCKNCLKQKEKWK